MALLRRHPLLLALLLGALAATGFAPLGLWPVTLLCIAGLMGLAQAGPASPSPRGAQTVRHRLLFRTAPETRHAFLIGWSFGVGHFTLGNNWIAHAFTYQDAMPHWLGYFAVVALSLYLAVYPGLATLGLHLLHRRWPALHATPLFAALWIVTEYGRATLFTGFAWNPLGMVWLDTGVDQAARVIGTYGLSGLAVIASGAILSLAQRRWHIAGPVAALLLALGIFGHIRLPEAAREPGPRITVVQPNIDQAEKHDPGMEQSNFARLARLTGPSSPDRPRLIFWPEDAVSAWLDMEPEWLARVAALAGSNDLLLTGGTKVYIEERDKGLYKERMLVGANNSAWVITPDARLIARYDKAHLVPYGEYLPMRGLLEPLGLSRLVPGDADFWPGPGPRSLTLPAAPGRPLLKLGGQICYEIIFSGQVIDAGDRPDFLYNPSNDAWFGSWGPPQHLAQARMRAIEEAMPVIRSTPTGISAVVDGRGAVLGSVPHHRAGVINTRLPPAPPPTLFSRFGNLLPAGLAVLLLALSAISLARRAHKR